MIMDQATAREWFDYDPDTGVLTWRKVRARCLKVGQEAGTVMADSDAFYKSSGKYVAYVKAAGRFHYLGQFAHLEDAIAARQAASEKYGFHPNHGSFRPL